MSVKRASMLVCLAYVSLTACAGCLGGSFATSADRFAMAENEQRYTAMRKSDAPSGDGILKLLTAIMLVGGLGALATMRLTRQFEGEESSQSASGSTSKDATKNSQEHPA